MLRRDTEAVRHYPFLDGDFSLKSHFSVFGHTQIGAPNIGRAHDRRAVIGGATVGCSVVARIQSGPTLLRRLLRPGRWGVVLAALVAASPIAVSQGGQGGNGKNVAPKVKTILKGGGDTNPPDGTPKPPIDVPNGAPQIPNGPGSDNERKVLQSIPSLWLFWWDRNQDSLVRQPSLTTEAHPSLPPHLLDADWRQRRRDESRPSVLQMLESLLTHDNHQIRGAAAVAIGRCGVGDSVEGLLNLLEDSNPQVRDRALLGAALATDSPVEYHTVRLAAGNPEALRALRHSDEDLMRAYAATFLALRTDTPILPFIEDLVTDRRVTQRIRALAIEALGMQGSAAAVATLVDLASSRHEPSLVRCAAVDALGRIGDRTAAPVVLRFLENRDPSPEVRVSAAQAIGHLAQASDRETVRLLERILNRDGNHLVRHFLLLSMGRIGGPSAQLVLENTLAKRRGEERCFAALGLGLLVRSQPSSSAMTSLLHHLHKTRAVDEQRAIAAALGISAHPVALEALDDTALRAATPTLRQTALQALKVHGHPDAIRTLEHSVKTEKDPSVLKQAALSLGQIDPVATNHLVRCLSDPERGTAIVRVPLLLALGHTGDPQALPILLDVLQTRGVSIREREAATWALGMVFDPDRRKVTSPIGFSTNFFRESSAISDLLALNL